MESSSWVTHIDECSLWVNELFEMHLEITFIILNSLFLSLAQSHPVVLMFLGSCFCAGSGCHGRGSSTMNLEFLFNLSTLPRGVDLGAGDCWMYR